MRALIVEEGFARGALAGVRGLRDGGWTVGVASPVRGLAASSRYTVAWHPLPALTRDPESFRRAVSRAVAEGSYDVVLPAGDAELIMLSRHRDELGAIVPLPSHDLVLRALDKLELARAAEHVGLATPRTVEPGDPGADALGWPRVVKPRLHHHAGSALSRLPARIATDPESLRAHVDRIERAGGAAVVQEHVTGRLGAWIALACPDGTVHAELQQEAELTHPPEAGVTARGRTVLASPELSDAGRRLLEHLGWVGLAQVQYVTAQDGRRYVLDFNGRFYGSMALALAAGVNFPAMWAATGTGRPADPAHALAGQRYQWFEGDLRSVSATRGRVLARELVRTVDWTLRSAHATWRRDDPRPAAVYGRGMIRRLTARRRGPTS